MKKIALITEMKEFPRSCNFCDLYPTYCKTFLETHYTIQDDCYERRHDDCMLQEIEIKEQQQ